MNKGNALPVSSAHKACYLTVNISQSARNNIMQRRKSIDIIGGDAETSWRCFLEQTDTNIEENGGRSILRNATPPACRIEHVVKRNH